jgi:hypothetical protein
MNDELLESIFDLVKSAIEYGRTGEPDGDGDVWLSSQLRDIIEEVRGIAPGQQELTCIVQELSKPEDIVPYQLIHATTKDGLPVQVIYLHEGEVEDIREALKPHKLTLESYGDHQKREARREAARQKRLAEERERTRTSLKWEEEYHLNKFAQANGRMWKQRLRKAWEAGTASEPLQYLRDHRCFGEEGLDRYRATTSKVGK